MKAAVSGVNVQDASVTGFSSIKNSANTTNVSFMTIITNAINSTFAENVTKMMSQNRSQNVEMTLLFNTTTLFPHFDNDPWSWIMAVYLVVTVLTVILGLFGSIFTIIIMRKEPFKSSSYGIHLTALAVADMLSLILITCYKDSTIYFLQKDIFAESNTICKMFIYSICTTRVFTSWNIVFISVERFIAVWFPFKFRQLSSKRTALNVTGCFFIAANIVAIFPTLSSSVRNDGCSPDVTVGAISLSIAMLAILHIIIPTIILLFFTPLTVFKLAKQQMSRRRMSCTDRTEHSTYATVMLIGIVISYIVLICSPFFARVVIRYTGTTQADSNYGLMNEIISITDQINCSINFFIYGLLGSEFRNQVIGICSSSCKTRTDKPEQ